MALCSRSRTRRAAALSLKLFQTSWREVRGADRDKAHDRRTCVIDVDGEGDNGYWRDQGVECARGHFVADASLEGHVRALSTESAGRHNGNVKCPAHQV